VQYFCHPCGHNFIDEDLTHKRYAVRAGMLHHERLSDETTPRWLDDLCPGERVVGDDCRSESALSYVGLSPIPDRGVPPFWGAEAILRFYKTN
jgi:hypothetical protein